MFRSTYSTITQHDCLKGSTQVIISLVLSGRAMVQAVWLLLLVSNLLIHECFSHYLLLTESSDLNNSLCGSNDGSVLPAGTQLLLSTDVHHILSSTSFCLVSNTSNITLRSVSSIIPATITCKPNQNNNSFASVGFGFYNVSGLSIENVHITKCGGLVPSPVPFILMIHLFTFMRVNQSHYLLVIALISCCQKLTSTITMVLLFY